MLSRLLERARSVAESALDGNVGKTAEDVGELARGRSKEAIERLRQRAQGLAETTARGIDDRLHRSRDNVRKRARGLAENVTQASKDAARKMQVEVERGGKQAQDAAKVMASNAASIAREEVHNRAQKCAPQAWPSPSKCSNRFLVRRRRELEGQRGPQFFCFLAAFLRTASAVPRRAKFGAFCRIDPPVKKNLENVCLEEIIIIIIVVVVAFAVTLLKATTFQGFKIREHADGCGWIEKFQAWIIAPAFIVGVYPICQRVTHHARSSIHRICHELVLR